MNRFACVAVAAALAVGSVAMTGCKKEDDGRTTGQKAGDAIDRAGGVVKNAATQASDMAKDAGQTVGQAAKDAKNSVVGAMTPSGASDVTGMRGAMEGIVQNALDANNFKTMTNHLVDADKQRLEATSGDQQGLNDAIAQFKKSWQDKYKDAAFGVQDGEKVYAEDFVTLQSSQANGDNKQGKATIKASHGMPQLDLNFVAQGGKWRLDVPDSVTPETLKSKLLAAVQDLNKDPGTWPADKVQATRLVSHKILAVVAG